MVPLENGVYYFEIEIEHETECFQDIGMRFCEEHVSLDGMLGCGEKSWGYHGYAGHIHACGQTERSSFGPRFGHGDTVGCGVNFHQGIAFYTLNGDVIGRFLLSTLSQGRYPSHPSPIFGEAWHRVQTVLHGHC
jgi:Ran-binding protein 9/10